MIGYLLNILIMIMSVFQMLQKKRFDGNWYDRADNKIIFEVKYFMDMQLLESNKED